MSFLDQEPAHNFKKHPSLPEALSAAQRIHGEVRRPGMSYRVQLAWDGKRLTGRLGGAIFGEGVYLEAHQGQLLGSLSSSGRVLALHAQHEGSSLQLRLVGAERSSSASLELSGDSASGWAYLEGVVQPVEVEFSPARLLARIGSDQEVTLRHPGFAAWVLAVVALAADAAARDAWRVLLESYTGWAEA
ncbi:hypothetical protein [Calidithermus timidus]|jgi:hypothetical protein|uniref:hypothetical protein n=1 Tax=Calidithermus timidus TaxID=307124 RepID=UPI00037AABC5|nr:hypothetical protein [Calidithermus timidus]